MKTIDQRKSEFLSKDWVENRQEYLQTLSPKEAQDLVESLSDEEVDFNVNYRKFQESYICDYLEYLWEISPKAFWQHVRVSLLHPDGMVIGESNFHIDKLERGDLPQEVWIAVLESIILIPMLYSLIHNSERDTVWGIDVSYSIMRAQTVESEYKERMRKLLIEWVSNFQADYREHLIETWDKALQDYQIDSDNISKIKTLSNVDKQYLLSLLTKVYEDELPDWLKKGLQL